MSEYLSIRGEDLDMSQATIMNSTARMLVAERYLARCPLETCVNQGKPGAEFVRDDSLVRHMNNPKKHKGWKVSKGEARKWTQDNMEIWRMSGELGFSNGYEEAIWRIWHGVLREEYSVGVL
jgi:hypothetical protein